jgi:hypothetical protein
VNVESAPVDDLVQSSACLPGTERIEFNAIPDDL